jgi:hypothetical protein
LDEETGGSRHAVKILVGLNVRMAAITRDFVKPGWLSP